MNHTQLLQGDNLVPISRASAREASRCQRTLGPPAQARRHQVQRRKLPTELTPGADPVALPPSCRQRQLGGKQGVTGQLGCRESANGLDARQIGVW